jgi:hypothetical protein
MLKIDSLNKEEKIESSESTHYFLSNSKCITNMLQYKFFDVRSLMQGCHKRRF